MLTKAEICHLALSVFEVSSVDGSHLLTITIEIGIAASSKAATTAISFHANLLDIYLPVILIATKVKARI